ncbi:hypothetical protein [Serratia sp. AKBS12]|uniref:hypothetical protein n=1 Tax=Serratia sp. AKBS12 TaxID=2974597 RepID=UPI0021655F74|nr:hypothetical protein [Serratia sp. AKBS12]MCS3408344.1 hypothetical protein [Serratia sp. AKBS12]
MLFPRAEQWCCQLQRRHIQLCQGEELHSQQIWQPSIPLAEQLDRLLSPLRGKCPWLDSIGFELDAPHVHYLLVPWPQGVTTPAELRQYARMLLAEQSGESPNKSQVSFFGTEYGANVFAAVLNDALFIELKTIAKKYRLRFRGCNTPFSRMLNAFGRRLPSDALFACISEHESNFAARYQGRWHSVFSLSLPPEESSRQLDIANRLAGLPPLERYVMHMQQNMPGPVTLKHGLPPTGTE